ncbi:hypothetical protein BJX70DRAFT_24613 [Aspergillus crustosus]
MITDQSRPNQSASAATDLTCQDGLSSGLKNPSIVHPPLTRWIVLPIIPFPPLALLVIAVFPPLLLLSPSYIHQTSPLSPYSPSASRSTVQSARIISPTVPPVYLVLYAACSYSSLLLLLAYATPNRYFLPPKAVVPVCTQT